MNANFAILYARVSTGDQQNSLTIQDERLRGYLITKQLISHPNLILQDEAVSGRKPLFERRNGSAAWRLLNKGFHHPNLGLVPVNHIVIQKVDRLARNTHDALGLYEWFCQNGKTLHVVDMMGDSFQTSGIMGKIFFIMQSMFAELEVETIRERTTGTLRSKRNRSELCGTVPYGWDAIGTGRDTAQGKEIKTLVPNERKQHWLRQMYQWRTAGLGWTAIATRLNRNGVPTKQGGGRPLNLQGRIVISTGKWQAGSVQSLLTSQRARDYLDKLLPENT